LTEKSFLVIIFVLKSIITQIITAIDHLQKGREYMEHRAVQIRSKKNKNISIVTIPGHFATNHSHVSHYIDMTAIKHSYHMAHEAAEEMAAQYNHSMQIDTIICMDGCEVIGGLLAHELI
jgi:orotate phosphoribosyltransferase